eukprot:TCONS_00015364-protein
MIASQTYNFSHDLDRQSVASVKKILLHPITFKDAQHADEGDQLRTKYKALNSNYKPGKMKSANLTNKMNDDLPQPQVVLFPEEKVELHWKESRKIGPGLVNLGNTCFLNSVLQVLTYTPPLLNYILTGYHKKNCCASGFCMQCELTNHFLKIARPHQQMGAIKPTPIIQKLRCIGKNFRFGRQEDAHEFLRFVIEAIQKSEYHGRPKLDKISKETTVANAIFGGFYRSQVKCLQCQHESNTYDPIMDVNLDIKECNSILHAFKKSVFPDRLDGDNKYFCDRCRKKTVAQKRGTIHKAPNVLTLQLKRFDFSKMFGGKISKDIHFPEDLNIRPYMSNTKLEPVFYKLYAVLVHSGYSCNSGHYYCYVRGSNGIWYEMNDSRVSQVSVKVVLSAQAYILFYVKAKKTPSNLPRPLSATHSNTSPHQQLQNKQNLTYGPQKPLIGPQKPSPMKDVPLNIDQNNKKNANSSAPYGVPVKRKPDAKISFNFQNKSNHTLTNPFVVKKNESGKLDQSGPSKEKSFHEKKMSMTSTPFKREELAQSVNSSSSKNQSISSSPTKKESESNASLETSTASSQSASPKKSSKEKKSKQPPTSLNSLQKLCESYGDTDSSSAASSPRQKHSPPPLPSPSKESKENKTLPLVAHKTKKHSLLHRNNPWSPTTAKNVLYPRIIVHKNHSSSTTESEPSHMKSKQEKSTCENNVFRTVSEPSSSTLSTQNKTQNGEEILSSRSQQSPNVTSLSPRKSPKRQSLQDEVTDRSEATSTTPMQSSASEWNVSTNDKISIYEKKAKKKKKKRKRHHADSAESSPVSSQDHLHDVTVDNEHSNKKRHVSTESDLSSLTTINQSRHRKRSHDNSNDEDAEMPSQKKKKKKKRHLDDVNDDNDEVILSPAKKKKKKKHKKRKHLDNEEESNHDYQTKEDQTISERPHSVYNIEKHQKTKVVTEDQIEETVEHKKKKKKKHHNRENRDYESDYTEEQEEKPVKEKAVQPPNHKKAVPVHTWDEEKKNVNTWDGSIKSKTIDQLITNNSKVSSWDGEQDHSDLYSLKNQHEGERKQDDWDEDYDAGKTKKVKKQAKEESGWKKDKGNAFQKLQDYRNFSKDNKAHFRHKNHHGDRRHSFHHHGHKKHNGGHSHHNGNKGHHSSSSKHNKTFS